MHPLDLLFRRVVPAALLGGATAALAVGWLTQPEALRRGAAPAQPLPFSHEQHAGQLAIPCLYCHAGAPRSPVAGLPGADLCMGCHRVTRVDRPAIQTLARMAERGEPLAWVRVHTLPDHVAFDHRPHLRAGFACQDCHGDVQDMVTLERRMNLRMGACLDCHRHPGLREPASGAPPARGPLRGPEHCTACHR
ncbi:cytochrome c3 family protein [Mesoterricola sediminis]|uniref:Class III cytochrome C domain protein n=1 Tax=Mesoterricola sediminis TaxID=2927980 RepID=A0AA48GQQ7_9BACT|nr:cytochrome c3 family protein [Mesoterricola sediminis]BDU75837.1 class III cytochrome C domain protein [Mesoterricola sediminis]